MNDQELVSKFLRTRSDEVFAAIVERHTNMVYSVSLRVLGDSDRAEDAAQATFVVLFREMGNLHTDTALGGWLFRVAVRVAQNMRKSQIRQDRRESEAVMMAQRDASEASWEGMRPELDGVVASLPAVQRDVVVLRYFNGMSRKEMARELKCPEGTVQIRLRRALAALRNRLRGRGVDVSAMALTGSLASRMIETAPMNLSGRVAAACLGKGSISAAALAAADETVRAMFVAKLKSWVAACAILVALSASLGCGVWLAFRRAPQALSTATPAPIPAPNRYNLEFSTFLGGSSTDAARDICVDTKGNIYVVGQTDSIDFPTTSGAYQQKPLGKKESAFVAKFSSSGSLVWSTVLNGLGRVVCFSVKVDSAGVVYVAGAADQGFPSTPGSFQPAFKGAPGSECEFVAKLAADGKSLLWSSYVGNGIASSMDLDADGNIYMVLNYSSMSTGSLPDSWFANALNKTPHGNTDCGVIKISNDGSHVIWATYVGGTSGCREGAAVRVGPDCCPVIYMRTPSTDMPTTSGSFRGIPDIVSNNGEAGYLCKLAADGSHLIFGAYIGSGGPNRNCIALDLEGNVFIATSTAHWPVTNGAYQTILGSDKNAFGIAKFSSKGALLAATYLKGNGKDGFGPEGICCDSSGNLLLTAFVDTHDFPTTMGCFQDKNGGISVGVLALLSKDLSNLLYSSYMGGSDSDLLRACCAGADGGLYVAGSSTSKDWPTRNASQDTLGGRSKNIGSHRNGVVAKFVPLK